MAEQTGAHSARVGNEAGDRDTAGFAYFRESRAAAWLFGSKQAAVIWLVARVYLGYEWLAAGWPKLFGEQSDAWVGDGSAVRGYLEFATSELSQGDHPALAYGWWKAFLDWTISSGAYEPIAWIVAVGEVAVGIALILGLFTGIAAFFGVVMNFSYMFSGSAGVNPLYAILGIFLVLSWRNAGYYGLDRWVLPALGTPGSPGWIWRRDSAGSPARIGGAEEEEAA
jgi:thiosulfate dehydrogenase [quinone] large subunit